MLKALFFRLDIFTSDVHSDMPNDVSVSLTSEVAPVGIMIHSLGGVSCPSS